MIRTTAEHPFYVRGTGWVPVKELRDGDRILAASGEWIRVEEVYDTGDWEPVYNLRVADFHTYFVGDEAWGFAVWAHNACIVLHQIQSGDVEGTQYPDGVEYAATAFQWRQTKATDPIRTRLAEQREYWRTGGHNLAYASLSDRSALVGPQVSDSTADAEVKLIASLGGILPASVRVTSFFTERHPCSACLRAITQWLRTQPGEVVVYYVAPYESGPTGNTLLMNCYEDLGHTIPAP